MINRIKELLAEHERVVVGIDGCSCSGKSTLAMRVALIYGGNLVHTDHFFLPQKMRTPERMKKPGGNIHVERLIEEVMLPLQGGKSARYRAFDCAAQDFAPETVLEPKRLTIVEGSYSMLPELAAFYDLNVFMRIDPAEQRRRVMIREGERAERFLAEWIPMENHYFKALDIANSCDIIVEA